MAETLGILGGALQGTVYGALSRGQQLLNKVLPAERRAELWARFNKFATERPQLTAFLLSHLALSGVPLGLFVILTITVAVFALVAALLVAILGALLFIVFAIGVALCFLLPTLFFTTLTATFIFLWGLGLYYLLKWFNEKKIPGIHTGFAEGIKSEILGSSSATPGSVDLPASNSHVGKAETTGTEFDEQGTERRNGHAKEQKHQSENHGNSREGKEQRARPVDHSSANVTKKADIPKLPKQADGGRNSMVDAVGS